VDVDVGGVVGVVVDVGGVVDVVVDVGGDVDQCHNPKAAAPNNKVTRAIAMGILFGRRRRNSGMLSTHTSVKRTVELEVRPEKSTVADRCVASS